MIFFLSFLQGAKGHPIPAYSFWQYYVKNGLKEAGHQYLECEDVDWALGLVHMPQEDHDRWKTHAWENTIRYIKKNKIDYFLSYLYPQQIDISAIKEIKRLGIPCINFFCDHVREFNSLPKEFLEFDLNWVPEIDATPLYVKNKQKYIHLPMPMWVSPSQREHTSHELNHISFLGSKDNMRLKLLATLIRDYDIDNLKIYGRSWSLGKDKKIPSLASTSGILQKITNRIDIFKKFGLIPIINKIESKLYNAQDDYSVIKDQVCGEISDDEYIYFTKNSKIVIGINRVPTMKSPFFKPLVYSRLRDIEAPMLGACYLTEYCKDLDYFYDVEKDILTYSNHDELQEKLVFLGKDSSFRLHLRKKGQEKALEDLSIPRSIHKIIEAL
jgi:hypothetical protein